MYCAPVKIRMYCAPVKIRMWVIVTCNFAHRMCYCVCTVITIMQTRHSFALYTHCQCCYSRYYVKGAGSCTTLSFDAFTAVRNVRRSFPGCMSYVSRQEVKMVCPFVIFALQENTALLFLWIIPEVRIFLSASLGLEPGDTIIFLSNR